jgi:SAM-dependent methyltransferase
VTTDSSNPPPTSDSRSHTTTYVLGSSNRERRRLMKQGELLRELLADAFRAAGIGPGRRVLDIGSGAGDVAMLAAELVGPTGSVVGLDRDPASVAAIAFFEPDFTVPSRAFPEMPEFECYGAWIQEVLRRSGARTDMGMRLYATYRDAGFVGTETAVSHLSGCGITLEMAEYLTETLRSVLPKLEQYGIATREEVQIDTLTDRVMAAGRVADPQWVSTRYIAAWAKKP